jgi:hypothetical protein
MRKIVNRRYVACSAVAALSAGVGLLLGIPARADTTPWNLAAGNFFQDWSNLNLITADNDWAGVPSIVGYRGEYTAANPEGVDPRTLTGTLTDLSLAQPSVFANQTSPNTLTSDGVAEFHTLDPDSVATDNPTIGLKGGPDADAPFLVIYLNTLGRTAIEGTVNLRDLDGSANDVATRFVAQWRIGSAGDWVVIPNTFISDFTIGPFFTHGGTGPLLMRLPEEAGDRPEVQVRLMTTNAAAEPSNTTGNTQDEWIGLDDIFFRSQVNLTVPEPGTAALLLLPALAAGGRAAMRRRRKARRSS